MSAAESYLAPTALSEVPTGTRLTPEQQAVVGSNLRLISVVVKPGMPNYEDAYQNGVFGLARAAQKFDPAKGFKFSTYAMWWIRQAVQRGGDLDSVHGPRNVRRGDPLPAIVALDAPVGEDGAAFGDYLPADDDPEADALRLARTAEIASLLLNVCKDDIDRGIADALLARSPPRIADLASRFDLSGNSIRQRQMRLIAKARHPVYRKQQRMTDLPTLEERAPLNGAALPARDPARTRVNEAPALGFHCDDCGRDFSRPQALGRHRTAMHGAEPKATAARDIARTREPASLRRPPKLDATSIKADLYDAQDDYDPWAVIVGHGTEEGPRAETMVLSTEVDAEQVTRVLAALGHRAWRFRLADGTHDA